jgi:transaldolase
MDLDLEKFNVKIFADGANLSEMFELADKPYISGLTTNPSLMKKAGITDYSKFAKQVLSEIKDKPISFEVFSDDLGEMKYQALKISSWGENVYVKVPITNSLGESTSKVVKELAHSEVKLNITAIMTPEQVFEISEFLNPSISSFISVFAGRIADTGRNPLPIMENCIKALKPNQNAQLIWASPRELYNIVQANDIGCHIITATSDILKKLSLLNHDLLRYSLETVQMFKNDALSSSFSIN